MAADSSPPVSSALQPELGEFVKEFGPSALTLVRYVVGACALIGFALAGGVWFALTVRANGLNPRGQQDMHESPLFPVIVATILILLLIGGVLFIRSFLQTKPFRARQYRHGFVFHYHNCEEAVLFRDIAAVDEHIEDRSESMSVIQMLIGHGGEYCRYVVSCRDGRDVRFNTSLAAKAKSIGVILQNYRGEFGYRWLHRGNG